MSADVHTVAPSYGPSRLWRTAIQCTFMAVGDLCAFAFCAALAMLVALGEDQLNLVDLGQGPHSLRLSIYMVLAACWVTWFGLIKQTCINRRPFWTELLQIFTALGLFAVADLALLAISRANFSRSWWFVAWFSLMFFVPITRGIVRRMLDSMELWSRPTVIFGCGENAHQAYLALLSEPVMGFKVKAFLNPCKTRTFEDSNFKGLPSAIPLLRWAGSEAELQALRGYHCVIAVESEQREARDSVIRDLTRHRFMDVHVIPAMRGVPLYGLETSQFFSHEVLLLQVRNNLASWLHQVVKRAFDIVGSILLLVWLSPLMVYIAFKISRDGGPSLFGHRRIGKNGNTFKCLKFRSMVVNSAEILQNLLKNDPAAKAEWDKDFKLKNDPRINAFGHFIRRSSLDELPQLWNVLMGEMSLVGPRPIVEDELSKYGHDVEYYLMTRPGMTGLWQVSGRNDLDYTTRVYLDSWYVKNWSVWSDIVILFKTIRVVIKRSGAY